MQGEINHQAIVWSFFQHNLDELVNTIGTDNCAQYHGRIHVDDRPKMRYDFQEGRKQWMVGNQATGGIGLTLTAGKYNVYYDNTFKADDRWQSERRTFRIGQDKRVVYIDLVMKGTVDELKLDSLSQKKEIADYVSNKIREVGSQALLESLVGS